MDQEEKTRGWDAELLTTTRLSDKEGEVDCRYMSKPDLPPVVLAPMSIVRIRPLYLIRDLAGPRYGLATKSANTLFLCATGARRDNVDCGNKEY